MRTPHTQIVPSADDETANGSSGASVAASAPGGRETPVRAHTHRECALEHVEAAVRVEAPHAHRAVARRAAQVSLAAAAAAAAAVGELEAAHPVGVPLEAHHRAELDLGRRGGRCRGGGGTALGGGGGGGALAALLASEGGRQLGDEEDSPVATAGGEEVAVEEDALERRRRLEARARRLLVGPRGGRRGAVGG